MAADTESAASIDGQALRIIRVVELRAMAIFTADGGMGGVLDVIVLVTVTLVTPFRCLIFDRIFLPFGLVGFAVPAIHVAAITDAKVARY